MAQFLKLDLRSLLLVLIAFIGNAQVMGIDLVLMIFGAALFTQFSGGPKTSRIGPSLLLLFTAALLIAGFRAGSIGIPYFDAYSLWPIKALCLMLLIATGKDLTWPMGNMIALAFICVALVGVGQMQDGRLVSVFGPNMLYRVFGFLMIFGVMLYPLRHGKEKLLMLVFAAFGLFASLLTGSSGAILTIAAVMALVALRFSRKLSILLGIGCIYLVLSLGPLAGAGEPAFDGLTSFNRLAYKLTTLEASSRVVGWGDILSQPFAPLGYDHADFWYLWSFGYQYPHNLFIELFGFYGLVGLVLALAVFVAVAKAIPKVVQGDILSMTLIVLAIGSMLSGDLSDNFGVIGLACGLLIRTPLKRMQSRQGSPSNGSAKRGYSH